MSRRKKLKPFAGVCITGIAESKRDIDRIREIDAERRREAIQGMLADRKRADEPVQTTSPSVTPVATTASDKSSMRELRLLKEFSESGLHRFVDYERLVQSPIFLKYLTFVKTRVVGQGDVSAAKMLASVFEMSQRYRAIVMWIADNVGISFFLGSDGHAHFKIEKAPEGLAAPFSDYLSRFSGDIKSVFPAKRGNDIDLLDSRLRLPGSFGSGRRR